MAGALGFIAFQLLLLGTGMALLRALGLLRVGMRGIAMTLGPALLIGASLVVPVLIVGLVIGIPLTPLTLVVVCVAWTGAAVLFARSRGGRHAVEPASSMAEGDRTTLPPARWFTRIVYAVAAGYAAFGAFALARLPTVGDDALIWSLKGLTLTYHHGLQPEIFQNAQQAGAHPVYPLFQPVVEALLSQMMGHPQLRLYHAELWLLFTAALWTAGYLIALRRPRFAAGVPVWVGVLALVALAPAPAINDLILGDADILGSLLLAVGALAMALWLETDDVRFLALAPLLLGAAANTKDEDLVGAILVVIVSGLVAVLRRRPFRSREVGRRLALWAGAAAYFALVVAPWRIWTAAHHLSDPVEPHLPQALNPAYVFDRVPRLHTTATAMINQVLQQWSWVAALFIALCILCLVTRTAVRVVCFYLASVIIIVLALLWLYTTTPSDLTFLLTTSMDRTVDVFLVPAALATAHLLAVLLDANRVWKEASVRRLTAPSSSPAAE